MELIESGNGIVNVLSMAVILDDSSEKAWAEKYVRDSKHVAWILGKYVEADNANRNRQFFALDELVENAKSLNFQPLNIGHAFPPVGTFVGNEIIYPNVEGADGGSQNAFVEALSVMWKDAFPAEFQAVEAAYKSGKLAYSMETKPEYVTCGGEHGCGQQFKYVGRVDPSYCPHINKPTSDMAKMFTTPHFTGGALIIPPVAPGWANADVTSVAAFDGQEAEHTYEAIKAEFSHLDPKEWEEMMRQILVSNSRTV